MQCNKRDSRSCTLPVSAKYLGSDTNAPLTTPTPLPKSQRSRLTFFGPRACFQRFSPLASNSSAGLSSAISARYSAMPSAAVLAGRDGLMGAVRSSVLVCAMAKPAMSKPKTAIPRAAFLVTVCIAIKPLWFRQCVCRRGYRSK